MSELRTQKERRVPALAGRRSRRLGSPRKDIGAGLEFQAIDGKENHCPHAVYFLTPASAVLTVRRLTCRVTVLQNQLFLGHAFEAAHASPSKHLVPLEVQVLRTALLDRQVGFLGLGQKHHRCMHPLA